MTQPTDFIEQLAALAEKATPGRWDILVDREQTGFRMVRTYILGNCSPDTESRVVAQLVATDEGEEDANAELIATVGNNLPAILALGRERDELREAVGRWAKADAAFREFERENPNSTTTAWDRVFNERCSAEDTLRKAIEGDNQ